MSRTIGILIAGHLPEELAGEFQHYGRMFETLLANQGFSFRIWFVVDEQFPETPEEADGWLISGSRHGVYDGHAWIGRLESFLRSARDINRPVVGICFGHQLMAQAMGGRVEKFSGGWGIGQCIYHGMEDDMTLLAWHQDQVVIAPPEAETLASSDFCAHAVLRYPGWGLSFQPHPEFTSGYFLGLVEARRNVVGNEHAERALTRSDNILSSRAAGMIADHFRSVWNTT